LTPPAAEGMLASVRHVAVTLLSGFAAEVDGEPVPPTAWRLRKGRELVKLLALAPGHRLHRERAIDVLWPDLELAAASNNLHQVVHAARRALSADAIEVRDGMLHLHADVDVDRLERAAADARSAATPGAYRNALSLYAGELLPENLYDDWAEERRRELQGLVDELEDGLAAAGEDARAPELPAATSSFVGRGRELVELRGLLEGTRLLTLAGTGGVGKTRLALELARGAQDAYPHGVALVELAPLIDGRLLPHAVAAALDVHALPGQGVVDALVEFLAPRSALLVLDNCEHLLAATAELADVLLRSAPGLALLAASREPLHVAGEVVFRVPSLDIPAPEQAPPPAELLRYAAVRLFVDRARAVAPGFLLDEANAADVARICTRLDGLPLALELAAGRLGALALAAIAARLDDRFRVLRTLSHTAPTRQRALAATIQWSHDLLEADERALLRRLAVFAGGFSLEAAERVCAGADVEAAGIADVLARLVEKSLVVAEDGPSPERRYRLLETIRLYALERLREAGETAKLAERHAAWAVALAETERGAPRLDRDAANLSVALDALLAGASHDALRLCVALAPFWLRRMDLHEARRRFDQALAAPAAPLELRAQALLASAAIDFRTGLMAAGVAQAEESHAVASELGDVRAQWRALQFLGECGVASDAAEVAMAWFERALEIAQREGLRAGEAVGVYSTGVAQWIRGDLARAEELVAAGIDLFRALEGSPERITSPINVAEIRSRRLGLRVMFEDTLQPFLEVSCDAAIGYALSNHALIARDAGDFVRARALLDESTARFAVAGDATGRAAALVRRAYLELAEGDAAAARAALEEALELRRRQQDRRGVALVLSGLGLIDTTVGDLAAAERRLADALSIFRRAGDRWGIVSTLWRTADLAIVRDRPDAAQSMLQEALVILSPTRRERWIAGTLAGLADVAELRGDTGRAAALLAEARDRYAAGTDAVGVAATAERLEALGC
jgi:predicted ATPase